MTRSTSRVLLVLVLAQFIITLDTTFMNVSLSTLVNDLHTTVTGVQSAIALYALVMAALMIAGAKFGDIIGRKRAFMIGLVIYAAGTTITSLAPNLGIFIFGWSILEGVGASIMLPAMMSLIADNFEPGSERSRAYAVFAATAGIAAAVGPIIGGLFTTYLSWRLAFASELIVAAYIMLNRHVLREQKLKGTTPKFDWSGFSILGFGLVSLVLGIILGSTYGLIFARKDFVVFGSTLIQAGGVAPTVILVLIGLSALLIFYGIEVRRLKLAKSTILDVALLKSRTISAGSVTIMMQQLTLTGVIFALSLYVQMNLNYSAIQSGLTLLPLSIALVAFSALAGRYFSRRYAPKYIMSVGFVLILLGVVAMGLTARDATSGIDFLIGLSSIGAGVGLVVSQIQNLMISSVKPEQSNETAGVINTFLNIGSALGTSLAGAIIIAVFVATATSLVNSSGSFNSSQKASLDQTITAKAQIVSNQQLAAKTNGLPPNQQQAIISINEQARERSLTVVYFALGAVGVLGLAAVLRLPKTAPLAFAGKPSKVSARQKRQGGKALYSHM